MTFILRGSCVASVVLSVLLLLQSAGIVPPVGMGLGDAVRGRAWDVGLDRGIIVRTASGVVKRAPPGSYAYGVQSLGRLDAVGVQYHRWNMTAGRTPQAAVLGTFAEVRIATGWPLLLASLLASLWVLHVVKARRLARTGQHCRRCGYDLRATPDRCPECGAVADSLAEPAGGPSGCSSRA